MLPEMFNLKGKVALVTGGSKGLGLAMARGFAEAGADIVISSRHEDELKAACAQITKGLDVQAKYFVADMSKRDQVERLAKDTLSFKNRVDILVNNAGTNLPQPIDKIKDEDWDRLMEINLNSVMALTRALVPQMKTRKWGRVIHISSIMGIVSNDGRNVYSATKAGLVGMAHASALDVGAFGITVNCISPGPFLTDLPGKLLSAEEKERFAKMTALGRWGEPRELVGTALLLASDAGSYITGANIVVDGGFILR